MKVASSLKLQLIPPPSAPSSRPLKIKVIPSTKVSALIHTYLIKCKLPLSDKDDLEVYLDDEELELTATVQEEEIISGSTLNIKHKKSTAKPKRNSAVGPSQSVGSSSTKGKEREGEATAPEPARPIVVLPAAADDDDDDWPADDIDWNAVNLAQLTGSSSRRSSAVFHPHRPSNPATVRTRPRPAAQPPSAPGRTSTGSKYRQSPSASTCLPTVVLPNEDEYEYDGGIPDEDLANLDLGRLMADPSHQPVGSPLCESPTSIPRAPPNTPDQHLPSPSQLASLIAASANAPSPPPRGFPALDDPPTSPMPSTSVSDVPAPVIGAGSLRRSTSPSTPDAESKVIVATTSPRLTEPIKSLEPRPPSIRSCSPRIASPPSDDPFAVAVHPLSGCAPVKEEETEAAHPPDVRFGTDTGAQTSQIVGCSDPSNLAQTVQPPRAPLEGKVEKRDLTLDFWGGGKLVEKGCEAASSIPNPDSLPERVDQDHDWFRADDGGQAMDSERGSDGGVEDAEAESTDSKADVPMDSELSSAATPAPPSSACRGPTRHLTLLDLPTSVLHHILLYTIEPLRLTNLAVLLTAKIFHTVGRPLLYRSVSLRSANGWRSFFTSGSGSQLRSSGDSGRRRDDYDAVRRLEILSAAPTADEGGMASADIVLALHEIHARRSAPQRSKSASVRTIDRHPFLPNLVSLLIALPSSPVGSMTDDNVSTTALDAFHTPFLNSLSFSGPHLVLTLSNVRHADQVRAAFSQIKGLARVVLDRPVAGSGRAQIEELARGSAGRIVCPSNEAEWVVEQRVEGWRRKSAWVGVG